MVTMDRAQLADFLRARREALTPEDVGLPRGPRRRAAGLRREEVAALAQMSVDYYSRLEQGRGPQPSQPMLGAIARALRLSREERDHLARLAGQAVAADGTVSTHVAPGLMRVLDRLQDTPAMVLSALHEPLVQTPPAVALLGDTTGFSGRERCTVYRWFTMPSARAVYPEADHDMHSRIFVSDLRRTLSRYPHDPRVADVVDGLLEASDEFAALWADHEVHLHHEVKRFSNAELGELTLRCDRLEGEASGQTLLVFTATPGTPDAEKLAMLGVIGAQRLG